MPKCNESKEQEKSSESSVLQRKLAKEQNEVLQFGIATPL